MSKKTIAWGVGSFLLVAVLAAGGFWLFRWQQQRNSGAVVDTSASAQTQPIAQNTTNGTTQNNQVLSDNNGTAATPTGQATNVPSSKELADYNKYVNDDVALFGDIKKGDGKEVTVNTKVAINYKGYLTNGTLFDETKPAQKNGPLQPFVFTVGKHDVILGMEQAIIGMKVGGQRRLIIPPKVGYGSLGQGNIPPNAVLVFDVELTAAE